MREWAAPSEATTKFRDYNCIDHCEGGRIRKYGNMELHNPQIYSMIET